MDVERHRRSGRAGWLALLAGLGVGIGVGILSSYLTAFRPVAPWGVVNGTLAAVAAAGITAMLSSRGAGRRLGAASLGLAAGVVALGAWWTITAWSVRLMTLEGAWIWPLALVSTVVAIAAVRSAVRRR